MNAMHVLRALGPIDQRNIGRDAMLKYIVVVPPIIALTFRFGVPWLTAALINEFGFDLTTYHPLFYSYLLIITPMLFGVTIGFLLLDERDDRTLTALQVTPMPLTSYIGYRIAAPMLVSFVMVPVTLWLAGVTWLSPVEMLMQAVGTVWLSPLATLFLGAFASNKVQGFSLMKGAYMLMLSSLAAFFVDMPWQLLFGFIPTYWVMKLFWVLDAGSGGGWVYLIAGLLYFGAVLFILLRRLNRVMYQ